MLRVAALVSSLHSLIAIGVSPSTTHRDAPIPWQSCPWLLQDRVDLRSLNPPQWCYNLNEVGPDDCARGYIGPDVASYNYRRCLFLDGKCTMGENIECRPSGSNAVALPPAEQPIDEGQWYVESPVPPPPPLPPPPPRQVVRASRPSPSPPPDVPDPFAPSMRLQSPRLLSADCQSVTLAWAAPAAALASGVPARYALYYGTQPGGSERPWNMGLRGTSATVSGLAAGTSYTFFVAMSQTRGWGPRSPPLVASTAATCLSPADQLDCPEATPAAPLVSPLNCVAMLVELPPMPSLRAQCSTSSREVVVQMRLQGEPWGDVRRDVQSSVPAACAPCPGARP